MTVGTAPIKGEVFVEPGAHVVEARLDGYRPAQATKELQAGGKASVELQLAREEPKRTEGKLVPDSAMPERVQKSGPNKTIVLVGAIAGAVAAGAGVGFHLGAHFKREERNKAGNACMAGRTPTICPEFDSAESARVGFAIAAITSYVAAGVLGAGTLTYVLATPSEKPQSSARVDLLLAPQTAGAIVTVPW